MANNLIDLTKKIGLNEYESKAYLALARMGSGQVAAISKAAAVPRARVYDVLTSLEGKGFVVRKPLKPVEFAALAPAVAFSRLEKRRNEEFQSGLEELKTIRNALESQLSASKAENAGGGAVYLVEGRESIYAKIMHQLENTKESVIFCSSSRGIKRKNIAFTEKLGALAERGVKVTLQQSHSCRFVVFDMNSVLLFLNPDSVHERQEKALWIESSFLANSICSLSKKK